MILHSFAIVLAVACFASFTWAIRRFFTAPKGVEWEMKWIMRLGGFFTVVHLLAIVCFAPQPAWRALMAIALYGAALGLFWWALRANSKKPLSLAYSKDKPRHLNMKGPYQYIRHPFYVAYTVAWLAGPILSGKAALLSTAIIMFFLYKQSADYEERKFRRSGLAKKYKLYQSKTGKFLPRF